MSDQPLLPQSEAVTTVVENEQPEQPSKNLLYEIINISDTITMRSPSFELACVLVLYVGRGQFGLELLEGTEEERERDTLPPLLSQLGGSTGMDLWFQDHFGRTFDESSDHVFAVFDKQVIAEVFLSVGTVGREYREEYETLMDKAEDPEAFYAAWDDKHRTSMSDIANCFRKNGHRMLTKIEAVEVPTGE